MARVNLAAMKAALATVERMGNPVEIDIRVHRSNVQFVGIKDGRTYGIGVERKG